MTHIFSTKIITALAFTALTCLGGQAAAQSPGGPNSTRERTIDAQNVVLPTQTQLPRVIQFNSELANAHFIEDNTKQYILRLGDTVEQKRALGQYARALYFTLNPERDSRISLELTKLQLFSAELCVIANYPPALRDQKLESVETQVVNTTQRQALYQKFLEQSANITKVYPHGNGCQGLS